MRQVGWAAGLGVFAIVAALGGTTPSVASCGTGDNGCDERPNVLEVQQREAEQPSDVGAPLPLQSKKITTRSKTQPSRQTTAQKSRKPAMEREAARGKIQDAPQAVKDAKAEAREADLAKQATTTIPIVGADEVNEIDERAAAPEFPQDIPTQDIATQGSQMPQPAPEPAVATPTVETNDPRLAMARVESTEQVENASNGDSAWASSSTIGKIFIALGGFLTAASAIRMFVG